MVSFTIAVGWNKWYIVGACVPPNDQPRVHRVNQVLACFPARMEMMLVRNLNNHLDQPRDQSECNMENAIDSHVF